MGPCNVLDTGSKVHFLSINRHLFPAVLCGNSQGSGEPVWIHSCVALIRKAAFEDNIAENISL